MSRIHMLDKDEAAPKARELYEKTEASGATVLNLYRVLAHSPSVMHNFMRLGNALLSKAELPAELRELAILRVARLTGSEYEWAQHYAIALEVGVRQEQAEAVGRWQDSKEFDDRERAVLQYTDEVAQSVEAKDDTFAAVRGYLSERSIVELTASIGWWGMVARFLVPLQVDIEGRPIASVQDLSGRRP